jgi:hypothetical protein
MLDESDGLLCISREVLAWTEENGHTLNLWHLRTAWVAGNMFNLSVLMREDHDWAPWLLV